MNSTISSHTRECQCHEPIVMHIRFVGYCEFFQYRARSRWTKHCPRCGTRLRPEILR